MPIIMAIINKSTNQCYQECGEKGTIFARLVGMQNVQLLENSVEGSQTIKNGTALRPGVPR